jgi:hypothetical protein
MPSIVIAQGGGPTAVIQPDPVWRHPCRAQA